MSIILPNSVFLHIPKTGGVWVREFLEMNNLVVEEIRSREPKESTENIAGSWHTIPFWSDLYNERPNRFCFVRNPLTWYRSHWSFRQWKKNWSQRVRFDLLCKDKSFNVYIDNVIRHYPDGYLWKLFHTYTRHCTYVGHQEDLLPNLLYFLVQYENVDIDSLKFPEKANVTPVDISRRAVYTNRQERQILWVEKKVLETYGYG